MKDEVFDYLTESTNLEIKRLQEHVRSLSEKDDALTDARIQEIQKHLDSMALHQRRLDMLQKIRDDDDGDDRYDY